VLMAPRLPQVRAVITLAGNLDTAAWTTLHDYSPLHGSLNPATQPPLPPGILQWHYVGDQDQNTPAAILAPAARRLGSRLRVIPGIDHSCCWEKHWPQILQELRSFQDWPALLTNDRRKGT